jgi:hypothetical protein
VHAVLVAAQLGDCVFGNDLFELITSAGVTNVRILSRPASRVSITELIVDSNLTVALTVAFIDESLRCVAVPIIGTVGHFDDAQTSGGSAPWAVRPESGSLSSRAVDSGGVALGNSERAAAVSTAVSNEQLFGHAPIRIAAKLSVRANFAGRLTVARPHDVTSCVTDSLVLSKDRV